MRNQSFFFAEKRLSTNEAGGGGIANIPLLSIAWCDTFDLELSQSN